MRETEERTGELKKADVYKVNKKFGHVNSTGRVSPDHVYRIFSLDPPTRRFPTPTTSDQRGTMRLCASGSSIRDARAIKNIDLSYICGEE